MIGMMERACGHRAALSAREWRLLAVQQVLKQVAFANRTAAATA